MAKRPSMFETPKAFETPEDDVGALMSQIVSEFNTLMKKANHSFQQTPTNSNGPQQPIGPR